MYVIGICEWNFIKVEFNTLYDGNVLLKEVSKITYNIQDINMSIFNSFEDAEKVIELINNNTNKIIFENSFLIGSILDGNKLDITKLKIYKLIPTEINKG